MINPPNGVLTHKDITCIFYSFKNKLPHPYFQSTILKIEKFRKSTNKPKKYSGCPKINTLNKHNNHSFDPKVSSNTCRNKTFSKIKTSIFNYFLKIKLNFIDKKDLLK